jgi:hypothetical protein
MKREIKQPSDFAKGFFTGWMLAYILFKLLTEL